MVKYQEHVLLIFIRNVSSKSLLFWWLQFFWESIYVTFQDQLLLRTLIHHQYLLRKYPFYHKYVHALNLYHHSNLTFEVCYLLLFQLKEEHRCSYHLVRSFFNLQFASSIFHLQWKYNIKEDYHYFISLHLNLNSLLITEHLNLFSSFKYFHFHYRFFNS